MRKIFSILLISFIALFLISCGEKPSSDIPTDPNSGEVTPDPTVDPTTDPVEDPKDDPTDEPVDDPTDPTTDPDPEPQTLKITLKLDSDDVFYVGKEKKLIVNVEPSGDYEFIFTVSEETVVSLSDDLVITALSEGTSIITCQIKDTDVKGEIEVKTQRDREAPEFVFIEPITKDMTISYNEPFDPRGGFKVIDNVDGDITDKVEIEGTFNNRKLGTCTLKYTVRDNSRNKTVIERTINVVWDYTVTFIGHAGCYSGLMNSAEAFRNAYLIHNYQAIECDVKQTKDGVFVTSHDDSFNGKSIASYTWEELKKEVYEATRGGIKYSTTLCTFEEYLKICKAGKCKAVVELKSSSGITNTDQSRMQALMDVITQCGMLHDVIFLGSQYNCLIWTRQNGYGYIPCQYLVNSCESETYLQRCIDNKLDISFNIEYSNSQEWIDRYHEAGCKVSCWTFSQYTNAKQLQSWIDKGVDFVTVDVTKPYEVNLPKAESDDLPTYKVMFKDYDGKVIKKVTVKEGKNAVSPLDPVRSGYRFVGWDKDYTNVHSNLEVNALYELETYTITYVANTQKVKETTWGSKEEFVNEFYTDLLEWISKNVDKMTKVSFDGSKYTTKSGVSQGDASFSTVSELRAMDLYIFESSISAWIYKPINGSNSAQYIPLEDNNYFLNTEPYRTKYQGMNAYLLNCIQTAYTSYSETFNQASNNRVQIFFRFHQWCKGTNIPSLDNYPKKYVVESGSNVEVTLPSQPLTYTVLDEVILPTPSCATLEFKGWYLEPSCTTKVDKIALGTTGDLVLYAGWK